VVLTIQARDRNRVLALAPGHAGSQVLVTVRARDRNQMVLTVQVRDRNRVLALAPVRTGNQVHTRNKAHTRNTVCTRNTKARNRMETTAQPKAKPSPGNIGDQTSACRNRAVEHAPNPLEIQGAASRIGHRRRGVGKVARPALLHPARA
jgi:hypothetical protein